MRQNILCYLFASARLCSSAKMGSENLVLVRLLQIGAKDLTVGEAAFEMHSFRDAEAQPVSGPS